MTRKTYAVFVVLLLLVIALALPYIVFAENDDGPTNSLPIEQRMDRLERDMAAEAAAAAQMRLEEAKVSQDVQSLQKHFEAADQNGMTGSRVAIAELRSQVASMTNVGLQIIKALVAVAVTMVAALMAWIWRTWRLSNKLQQAEISAIQRHAETSRISKEFTESAEAALQEIQRVARDVERAAGHNRGYHDRKDSDG